MIYERKEHRRRATVDMVIDFVRKNRLATQFQIAEGLGISTTTAHDRLRKARRAGTIGLLKDKDGRPIKDEYGRFQHIAMIEWPSCPAGWAQTFANRVAGIRR